MLQALDREWLLIQNEMGMRYFARLARACGARGVRGPCHRRLFLECRQKDLQRRCRRCRRILAQRGGQEMCIEEVLNRLATRQGLEAIPQRGSATREGRMPD
jgi:hypothetical protein